MQTLKATSQIFDLLINKGLWNFRSNREHNPRFEMCTVALYWCFISDKSLLQRGNHDCYEQQFRNPLLRLPALELKSEKFLLQPSQMPKTFRMAFRPRTNRQYRKHAGYRSPNPIRSLKFPKHFFLSKRLAVCQIKL